MAAIVTERDVLKAVAAGWDGSALVTDWMTKHRDTIEPTDTTDPAAALMIQGGFRHLPVWEGGRVVGIFSSAISCESPSRTARRAASSSKRRRPSLSSVRPCRRSRRTPAREATALPRRAAMDGRGRLPVHVLVHAGGSQAMYWRTRTFTATSLSPMRSLGPALESSISGRSRRRSWRGARQPD